MIDSDRDGGFSVEPGMQTRVEQPIDRFSILEVLLHNVGHILWKNPAIPGFIRENAHRRAHIALPLAAHGSHGDSGNRIRFKSRQYGCRLIPLAVDVLANQDFTFPRHHTPYRPKPLPRLVLGTVRQASTCDRSVS